jgi:hypothetical protein
MRVDGPIEHTRLGSAAALFRFRVVRPQMGGLGLLEVVAAHGPTTSGSDVGVGIRQSCRIVCERGDG